MMMIMMMMMTMMMMIMVALEKRHHPEKLPREEEDRIRTDTRTQQIRHSGDCTHIIT